MHGARALAAGTAVASAALGGALLLLGDDDPTSADTPTADSASMTSEPPAEPLRVALRAIGDRTLSGGAMLVLHGVEDPFESSDPVVTPVAGDRWVATDVQVMNVTTSPISVSSRQFSVRDVTNRRFGLAETAEPLATIDGSLGPGQTRRATLVFVVPEDARDLRLSFSPIGGAPEPVFVSLG